MPVEENTTGRILGTHTQHYRSKGSGNKAGTPYQSAAAQGKMSSPTVHLVFTWAPLLSGKLSECLSADDESCEGGVAAVAAYLRHFSNGQPSLVVPFADKNSPFVQMHPLGWSVNRLVLNNIMGWTVMGSTPSLLTQNRVDYNISFRDISDMQSKELPLLLTNVAIPPGNSWFPFSVPVYFHEATGLAVMVIWNSNEPLSYPQIESTTGVLDYIARVNLKAGCSDAEPTLFDQYVNRTEDGSRRKCWVPVVLFADVKEKFAGFLDAVVAHTNPPAIIVDVEGNAPPFEEPRRVGGSWLVSYFNEDDAYLHHKITLSQDRRSVDKLEMIVRDLEESIILVNTTTNATIEDEQWKADIIALRKQADEASINDPVVGQSTQMPVTRKGTYRRCKGGECEIGNLFTDAARWWAGADVAFTPSGGLRGEGWAAGGVKVSNIWDSLPFPNSMCTGTMNGVSLFKLFNYSINAATFEGENTSNGDRLLQISGMRITYNTEMTGSRIVKMETLDEQTGEYDTVERLKLYDFVTDSFVCGGFDPYPSFLGEELTAPGEVQGHQSEGSLYQNVVADYLSQLDSPYVTGIMGRLVNDTSAKEPLNLIQTADACEPGTYWREEVSTCELCPGTKKIAFLRESIEFDGVEGSDTQLFGSIAFVNTELVDVAIVPKSRPSWLNFPGTLDPSGDTVPIVDGSARPVSPGERVEVNVTVDPRELEAGTAQGTVSFGVLDSGSYPGCTGQDISFEVLVRVLPEQELNQLGSIRYTGWALSGIVLLSSLFFTVWVSRNRKLRIVKTLQPVFLAMISSGVLVMGSAIVPLSIDDEISSQRGCNIACMVTPWLLSMGFTIAMSALFSKLWRINKLFHNPTLRRMTVEEKDVMAPFVVLFTLNFIFLLVWTLVEPLRWFRVEVENKPWESFGSCRSEMDGNGAVSIVMTVLVCVVNFSAVFVAGFQAYQARNISDEFSESKNMGVALFSWFQLMIVGFPVLYLIGEDNPGARYFLQVLLVFAVSMSMLLLIFVPMMIQVWKGDGNPSGNSRVPSGSQFTAKNVGRTRVSGLEDFGISNFEETSKEHRNLPGPKERQFDSESDNGDVGQHGGFTSGIGSVTHMSPSSGASRKRNSALESVMEDSSELQNSYSDLHGVPAGKIKESPSGLPARNAACSGSEDLPSTDDCSDELSSNEKPDTNREPCRNERLGNCSTLVETPNAHAASLGTTLVSNGDSLAHQKPKEDQERWLAQLEEKKPDFDEGSRDYFL